MKYWNKDRKIQETTWHKIELVTFPDPLGWHGLKRWCQLQPSTHKFFSHPVNPRIWYIQDKEDALIFKLKYHGK